VQGKKGYLAALLAQAGLAGAARSARYVMGRHIPILAYHRILEMGPEHEFLFDAELVSASPEQFRWQMEYLARHYDPITVSDLLDGIAGNRLPRRPVIVTFDDGFEDNYRVAYPILRKSGVPATFFVSTGYIGGPQTFWFDEVVYRIRSATGDRLVLPSVGLTLALGSGSRKEVAGVVLRRLKEVSDAQRRMALDELRVATPEGADVDGRAESRVMTWEQVEGMARGGMEIGSHTVTHPILSRVDRASVDHELRASREAIEGAVGRKVRALSYPVGGVAGFNEMVQEAAAASGYDMAVSYISGTNPLRSMQPYAMRRIHVERYVGRAGFAAMLAVPEVFALGR